VWPTGLETALTIAVVIGQLSFGVISDKLGRKLGMFITTVSQRTEQQKEQC